MKKILVKIFGGAKMMAMMAVETLHLDSLFKETLIKRFLLNIVGGAKMMAMMALERPDTWML